MEWGKAKTYLIIAFTITNIILLMSISSDKKYESSYFSKESYISLDKFLLQKNLSLHTELPKETPKMGTLKVEYQSFNKADIYRNLSNSSYNVDILGDKNLVITGQRKLSKFNEANARQDVQIFLKENVLGSDYEYKDTTSDDRIITVTYNAIYKNRFLEDSYIKFTYSKNGEFKLEMLKMIPVQESKTKKTVMTSIEAVMRASSLMLDNEEITEVVLGYNYTQYQALSIAKTKTATAFPCWRIKTKSNKYYYIEALEF